MKTTAIRSRPDGAAAGEIGGFADTACRDDGPALALAHGATIAG